MWLLATSLACFQQRPPVWNQDTDTGEIGTPPEPEDSPAPIACDPPLDGDGDGWQHAADGGTDCWDHLPQLHACDREGAAPPEPGPCVPDGADVCDGLDNDCDGLVDDSFVLTQADGAYIAAGALLVDGAPAIVVGHPGTGAIDGYVDVLDTTGALVVRIDGAGHTASFGSQIGTGRDLTGDGVIDLVIAAPFDTVDDVANSGRVWVLPGPLSASTTLADAAWTYDGGALDGQVGGQLALLPDLDGDGIDDLALGYYRWVLLFSGGTPFATIELNTGGGAWRFATRPDEDGDARRELVLGMSTYSSGTGFVATFHSSALHGDLKTWSAVVSDAALPGLGAGLVEVDDVLWSLSGSTPVRLDDLSTLTLSATNLENGGDLDGDGHDDLVLADGATLQLLDGRRSTEAGSVQSDRDTRGASDLDGDGLPDLRVVTEDGVGVLSGALAFVSACNADGDDYTIAQGDCDDENAAIQPGATEVCDGLDNDCDGAVDVGVVAPLATGVADVVPLGDVDGDGLADVLLVATDGTVSTPWMAFDWARGGTYAGNNTILLQGDDALVLVRADASSDEDLVAGTRILDGTTVQRGDDAGHAGDLDGDGVGDLWLRGQDPVGHAVIVAWHAPLPDSPTLDDGDLVVTVPDGWTELAIGRVRAGDHNDLTADGRDDLLIGSRVASTNQGRVSVVPGGTTGTDDVDTLAILSAFGEPGEEMGTRLWVGRDLDADGHDDALIYGKVQARTLTGGTCPDFASGRGFDGVHSEALVDTDGDHILEWWTSTSTPMFAPGDVDGDGIDDVGWIDGDMASIRTHGCSL